MPQYPLTDQDRVEIENRFTYHRPKDDQPERYEKIRNQALLMAFMIYENVPPGRQRSLALTALEEVTMRSNAGIAQGE